MRLEKLYFVESTYLANTYINIEVSLVNDIGLTNHRHSYILVPSFVLNRRAGHAVISAYKN